MALNPVTYTERVVEDFLRYQLTTYPLADEDGDVPPSGNNLEQRRLHPMLACSHCAQTSGGAVRTGGSSV